MNQYMKYSAIIKGIENGIIPRYVYKYVDIQSAIKIIQTNSIKFNSTSNFNDPYDGKAFIQYNFSYEDISSFFGFSNLPVQEQNIEVSKKAMDISEMQKMAHSLYANFDKKTAITCFSEIGDNIKMWSHYANSHKGICLKFDLIKDLNFFSIPVKVEYNDKITSYKFSEAENFIYKQYSTKSKEWEYEKEIRIIKSNTSPSLIEFKKEALIDMVFGCSCTEEDICKLRKMLKQHNFNVVNFKRAILANLNYKLDIIPA
ncbi:DUF2971 domain-containing protein [Bacteroides sp.]|uniref:DUF2971 domain-containing protein n=1 Tax=Bacteroides sp. TaxID=29523 RepID=UPI00263661F0|nr:DUF2971 domain-containing protein [Bacteroides sp.]